MKYNRICSNCGKRVPGGEKCPCQKRIKYDSQKNHIRNTRKFRKLRQQIIVRDNGHCQRCRIKYNIMTFDKLQAHHIKSFRDYPELAYEPTNLIMVCVYCNNDLGNSNKLDFEWEVKELDPPCL